MEEVLNQLIWPKQKNSMHKSREIKEEEGNLGTYTLHPYYYVVVFVYGILFDNSRTKE